MIAKEIENLKIEKVIKCALQECYQKPIKIITTQGGTELVLGVAGQMVCL